MSRVLRMPRKRARGKPRVKATPRASDARHRKRGPGIQQFPPSDCAESGPLPRRYDKDLYRAEARPKDEAPNPPPSVRPAGGPPRERRRGGGAVGTRLGYV